MRYKFYADRIRINRSEVINWLTNWIIAYRHRPQRLLARVSEVVSCQSPSLPSQSHRCNSAGNVKNCATEWGNSIATVAELNAGCMPSNWRVEVPHNQRPVSTAAECTRDAASHPDSSIEVQSSASQHSSRLKSDTGPHATEPTRNAKTDIEFTRRRYFPVIMFDFVKYGDKIKSTVKTTSPRTICFSCGVYFDK